MAHVKEKGDCKLKKERHVGEKRIAHESDQTSEEELMEGEVEVYMELDDSEIDFCYMKKKWKQKETRLRAEKAKELTSEVTQSEECNGLISVKENKKSNPNQIFSTSAASGILTNDLITLLKSKEDNGIKVKPINDNIYQWSVKFSKFDAESALHCDLQELKKKHGYDYIELQLEFTMDLYPLLSSNSKDTSPTVAEFYDAPSSQHGSIKTVPLEPGPQHGIGPT
uniref:(California timema) hypothetical protein n=1 Tax=Timema californicum TaxID=61474 RepID=A0A7R9IW30_TIMCA|nr:unnamed protein product [Timema californicum]